jgi:hypothetical protein
MDAIGPASLAGRQYPVNTWQRAHHALSRLARQRASLDAEEGRCLLAAFRAATHVHLGFGTFAEYVERLFGYSPRSTHEKLRVAEALEGLPALSRALQQGDLSWSALRELTRVATEDTEQAWLEFASSKTVRQLAEVVARTNPGDRPESPRRPAPRRHVLRFEVAPETFALFREASAQLRRDSDASFDDDALLLAMARAVLGGPIDEGRASYRVSLSVCSACGQGQQHASGALISLQPEIIAMAMCDAQHIGNVNDAVGPANDSLNSLDADADSNANADVLDEFQSTAGTDESGRASISAGAHSRIPAVVQHFGARPGAHAVRAHTGTRAKQTIPPALRRAILARDQHRCSVPGCMNATFLDLHHILPRSEGGDNVLANLHTLCGAHHRAVHRGQLIIERDASGLRFLHAKGRPYGEPGTPPPPDTEDPGVESKVAFALRHLGFRDAEVRAVLTELRKERCEKGDQENATTDAARSVMSIEWLLREALVRLGAKCGTEMIRKAHRTDDLRIRCGPSPSLPSPQRRKRSSRQPLSNGEAGQGRACAGSRCGKPRGAASRWAPGSEPRGDVRRREEEVRPKLLFSTATGQASAWRCCSVQQ